MTILSSTVSSRGARSDLRPIRRPVFFRPLISLHYYLDHMLWGMSPLASHAVNLLWHIVCGLLVWLLAQRMLARWCWHPTPARGAALVAAHWHQF